MSEHEKSITVGVPAASAFRYLSSVSNLPSFFPQIRAIREDEPDHIVGTAQMGGREYEMSGFFRADDANRRLDWESDGTPGYRGWLSIAEAGTDTSLITVHLAMDGAAAEVPPPNPGLASEHMSRDLERAMRKLQEVLEQQARANR